MKTILLTVFLILVSNLINAQEKNTAFDWKLKPGMPEWKSLQTHQEMVTALTIPEETLKNLSTEDLVITCLNYPLFPDIWAFNSFNTGIETAISNFNGFQELLLRKDAGKELIKQYVKIKLEDYESKNNFIEKGDFKLWTCKIEALLTLDKILDNIEKSNRESLLLGAIQNGEKYKKNQTYAFFNNETNFYLTLKLFSKIIPDKVRLKMNKKEFEHFYVNGSGATLETINNIAEIAEFYLSKKN